MVKSQIEDNESNILHKFFPDFQPSEGNHHSSLFEQILNQRNKSLDLIFKTIQKKKKTFAQFGFKTQEKYDNSYLRPVIKNLTDEDIKGTMSVVDLWNDKNQMRFLGNCKLLRDKLMMIKISKQLERLSIIETVKPIMLSRKEEQNLINKIYVHNKSQSWAAQQLNSFKLKISAVNHFKRLHDRGSHHEGPAQQAEKKRPAQLALPVLAQPKQAGQIGQTGQTCFLSQSKLLQSQESNSQSQSNFYPSQEQGDLPARVCHQTSEHQQKEQSGSSTPQCNQLICRQGTDEHEEECQPDAPPLKINSKFVSSSTRHIGEGDSKPFARSQTAPLPFQA